MLARAASRSAGGKGLLWPRIGNDGHGPAPVGQARHVFYKSRSTVRDRSSTEHTEETMKPSRFTLVVLLLAALSFMPPTWATSFSNDQSDLWWNSGENGWGIQFVQRGSTIFATMFVYDASGNPTFYVATMEGTKASGVLTFTGTLYTTHGSWFGTVPYNPAAFGGSPVGMMTWVKAGGGEPGTLTYSVNGVNVTKSLTRQPIRNDDYTGTYTVGLHLVVTARSDPLK